MKGKHFVPYQAIRRETNEISYTNIAREIKQYRAVALHDE